MLGPVFSFFSIRLYTGFRGGRLGMRRNKISQLSLGWGPNAEYVGCVCRKVGPPSLMGWAIPPCAPGRVLPSGQNYLASAGWWRVLA